ncbi:hypothetical protein NM688_g1495 [Phlebia brevispora]|uniref:Uncharacterized protein n=1 Tax=Phlebia brevispora TaxID=194682 RepID=A0ACC1TBE1_9APHY|nr:hypothetical protein NM688_g1495 [Phlebia brevispora]
MSLVVIPWPDSWKRPSTGYDVSHSSDPPHTQVSPIHRNVNVPEYAVTVGWDENAEIQSGFPATSSFEGHSDMATDNSDVSETQSSSPVLTMPDPGQKVSDLLLRRQHNAGLPTSKLPAEILLEIFKCCCGPLRILPRKMDTSWPPDELPSSSSSTWLDSESIWQLNENRQLALSHVYSHWRSASLSMASLWSDFVVDPGTPSEAVSEWLARSRGTSLYLTLVFPGPYDPPQNLDPLLDLIAPELDRTGRLTIAVNGQRDLKLLYKFFAALTSHKLEELILVGHFFYIDTRRSRVRHDRPADLAHPTDAWRSKFSRLLRDKFPALKVLDTNGVPMLFALPECKLPSTLTSLRLWSALPEGTVLRCSDVLDGLRSLPTLRELTLVNDFKFTAEGSTGTLKPVSLPSLKELIFRSYTLSGDEPFLLDLLEFPPLHRFNVELYVPTFDVLRRHRSLASYIHAGIELRTISMHCGRENAHAAFKFRAWTDTHSVESFTTFGPTPSSGGPLGLYAGDIELQFNAPAGYSGGAPALHDLLAALPTAHAHILHLRMADRYNHTFHLLPSAITNMKKLRTLVAVGARRQMCFGSVSNIADLLNHRDRDGNEVVFPELQKLCLYNQNFDGALKPFVDALKSRRKRARPIASLVLHKCSLPCREALLVLSRWIDVDGDELMAYNESRAKLYATIEEGMVAGPSNCSSLRHAPAY